MWWKLPQDLVAANLEAQRVIALRLAKLARGDAAARKEAQRMANEKIAASIEAGLTLASGGSPERVLRRYRALMRANAKRLSKKRR